MSAHARARAGIAHVPEGRQVFASMSVRENIEVGGAMQTDASRRRRATDLVYTLFPVLAERAAQLAGMLSGGQQQMVAIGRGLASDPRLLMLDEPSMGLAPAIVETIFERIATLRASQTSDRAARRTACGRSHRSVRRRHRHAERARRACRVRATRCSPIRASRSSTSAPERSPGPHRHETHRGDPMKTDRAARRTLIALLGIAGLLGTLPPRPRTDAQGREVRGGRAVVGTRGAAAAS